MEGILGQRRFCIGQNFYYLSCLGCGMIILCSCIKIPFFPVPFTLQTFAVFILALSQSPKQAAASVICYLLCATIGLPVFGGRANPFWMMGKCGGYLIGFPFAAYLTAKLSQRRSPVIAVLCGQTIIYLFGLIWLVPLFGMSFALIKGVLIFIPSDMIKNFLAIRLTSASKKEKNE
jgi:biotin transport system substrate-specific component